jgi:hypothetical protein
MTGNVLQRLSTGATFCRFVVAGELAAGKFQFRTGIEVGSIAIKNVHQQGFGVATSFSPSATRDALLSLTDGEIEPQDFLV